MDSSPKAPPLPHQRHHGLFWPAYRRRPALLLGLLIGLAGFLFWLPDEARTALWLGLRAQRLLIAMLLLFMLVALSLAWSVGQYFDSRIFLFFNLGGYHPAWLDNVMWLVTQLGSMLAAFAAALLFFFAGERRLAVEVILGTLTLWLYVETVKLLTDRARPFLVLEGTRIVGRRETGRSFPSGHTSQAFFMAMLLTRQLQLGIGESISIYLLAALVGFTRVYVGAHYPRDVIAGALLGSLWGILTSLMDAYLLVFGI
jgi:membrane-associated phospholipid phosphatase